MKLTLNRAAPVLLVVLVLAIFTLANTLDAAAAGLDSPSRSSELVLLPSTKFVDKLDVTTAPERHRMLTALCGHHKDVAPTVSESSFLAVIRTVRQYPTLRQEACRSWLSHRAI